MDNVLITDYDIEGRGIARIDNVVTFVSNALKDEIVTVEIIKKNKNFNEGIAVEILESSKNRIQIKCPYFLKCGGCNLMHMNYEEELSFKEKKVKNTIKKLLKEEVKIKSIVPSDEILNYRNKVSFHVKNEIGFFEKKSNSFLKIDNCLICNSKINDLVPKLKMLDLSHVNNIFIRATLLNEVMVIIDSAKDLDVTLLKEIDSVYVKIKDKYILKSGKKSINEKMNDFVFSISPSSFFQVNTKEAIKLYNKVKEYACLNKNDVLLDLYCGTGTIGIFLSKDAKKVYGIEINEEAILDANYNKKINNINNIEFYAINANQFLTKVKEKIDVIVVDPPRGGLDKKTIDSILKIKPKKLIYVSCNVATLSRDLNFLRNDYNILEITLFDMFPRTSHVECVCLLSRKE